MPLPSALEARVAELERERKHLLAIIEILKEVSTSLHFIDILQGIARKLGEAFGLDRCSIFLAERGGRSVRLVASYEDPTIRNYVVDLERYPELKRAMQGGETVFIPDVATDPSLKHVKSELLSRRVKSITVVPITWRKVRRKIAPIATPRHVIGTTVMDFTRRLRSSLLTCFKLGSVAASGMNTVSPPCIARFSSGSARGPPRSSEWSGPRTRRPAARTGPRARRERSSSGPARTPPRACGRWPGGCR